jgi:putative ABC transport system permease protein
MLAHHIKLFFRNIRRCSFFSFLNIGGFAVGFAVCMVLALYAYKEYNVDKVFPDYQHIFRVIDANKNSSSVDFDVAKRLKEQYSQIKSAVPLHYMTIGANHPVFLKKQTGQNYVMINEMISTTNDFFKTFSVKIIAGNTDKPFADLNSVVITRSTAQKLFGRTDVVGEIVNFVNMFEVSVSAVSEDLPAEASLGANLFFNADNEKLRFTRYCSGGQCYNPVDLYVQVDGKANIQQLEANINANIPANKSKMEKITFQPLSDIYLHPGIDGNSNKLGSKAMIRIFLSIAALIMLLSVINYVNISLSKQLSTLREIGIKITNGAGPRHLCAYYLTEVVLSVAMAFAVALGIVWLSLPFAGKLLNCPLSFGLLLSPALLGVFSFILFSVILFSSFAPVYIVSRFDVQRLFGKKTTVMGKQLGKKGLTIFQLITAIVLLIGFVVIQKQLNYVKTADLGFNKECLLRLDIGDDFKKKEALKQQIDHSPFVKSASFSHGGPGAIRMGMGSNKEGENFNVDCISVDEEFLKTFDIQLLEGRTFLASDKDVSCYINETAYKKYGWDNLENRKFNNGREGGYHVIGVVRDFNVASLHSGMTPVCLLFHDEYSALNIRLMPGNLHEQVEKLRSIWKEVSPDAPMMFTFYDDVFNAYYMKEERQGEAITVFSLIALLITSLGLMGQIFQMCTAKSKEIGIRKVNGAKVSEVMAMLNKDFVKWVVVAFVIATPIAYYTMNKWLENFAYKTELSWWIFALSGLLALGIALLTVSWQSWRAATRDPVEALRNE